MQEIQKFQDIEREGVIRRDTNLERNRVDKSTEIERDEEYNIKEIMPVLKYVIDIVARKENSKTSSTSLNSKSEEYSEICKEVIIKEVRSPEDISCRIIEVIKLTPS